MEKNQRAHAIETIAGVFKNEWVMGIPVFAKKTEILTGVRVLSHGKDADIVSYQARNLIGEPTDKKIAVMNTSRKPMPIVVFEADKKPQNFGKS